jgi:predicted nucleic acid-binding protein
MNSNVFFDSNVLVYFLADAGYRTEVAEKLVVQGGVISVQVLSEMVSVARRKLKMTWADVRSARDKALVFCPEPVPLTVDIHRSAIEIGSIYGYTIYDSLILAAALQAGCATVYSEDMQHGQVVEGLRIENPFLGAAKP